MPSTAKSPPASPSAARRYTSPPPTSPPRASLAKPATPDKKASTPAPASAATPPKKADPASPTAVKNGTEKAEEAAVVLPSPQAQDDIDESIFSQITEMDDDDPDCEFSREIVVDYFKQAATTFEELHQALNEKDLATLSAKGHFLKGSSAALGVVKVQESCEHIQHYGAKRDEIKGVDLTAEDSLRRIKAMMPRLERDYALAEVWLRDYYSKQGIELNMDGDD